MLDTIFHYATFIFVKGRVERENGNKGKDCWFFRWSSDTPQNPEEQVSTKAFIHT